MKMQRKWRRAWKNDNSICVALQRPKDNHKGTAFRSLVRKLLPPMAAAGLLLSTFTGVQANPSGGQITTGKGTIAQSGSTMTITQSTNKLGINWQSFGINKGEKVQFVQPGKSSIALNRVIGNNPSDIYGTLSANGKVFLVNPNGILFAPGAQVNVGGIVASTLGISDSDFLSGRYHFTGNGGSVINQGNIAADNGGYVFLIGGQVSNQGRITAKQGTVALGAGNAATIDINGDGLYNLVVDQSARQAFSENSGMIQADGGRVLMTARAAEDLIGTAVNNSGVIQARGLRTVNGVIILDSGTNGSTSVRGTIDASGKEKGQTGGQVKVLGGTVELSGKAIIDASGANGGGTVLIGGNFQGKGPEANAKATTITKEVSIHADALTTGNGGQIVVWADDKAAFYGAISAKGGSISGNGGNVEVSGKNLLIYQGFSNLTAAKGKTGNLLLDPADYVIASSGGDSTGAAIGSQLEAANVTILSSGGSGGTDGDIFVNDNINWVSGNSLTLSAYRDVNINADIKNTNSAGANLVLRADNTGADVGTVSISAGNTITTNGQVDIYYNPSGTFNAAVNGSSVTIKNYTSPTDYSGFVQRASGESGAVSAYMLVNDVNQLQAIGANNNTLGEAYAIGKDIDASVTANWNSGAGFTPIGDSGSRAFTGTIDGLGHLISNITINNPSTSYVGLFGYTESRSVIRNVGLVGGSVKSGDSFDSDYVGGLIGYNNGSVSNSYSTGTANHSSAGRVGGLVGYNGGSITDCYNLGDVSGYIAGGLTYHNTGSVTNSYNAGYVRGSNSAGGLVNTNSGTIMNCYNTGDVINSSYGNSGAAGGLVGHNGSTGNIRNSYNTGNVTAYNFAGGLADSNQGIIANSYNTGTVVVGDSIYYSYGGGLVGNSNSGSITDSYSTGNVTGGKYSYVGGLVGDNYSSIINCYSTGKVTSSHSAAGLVNRNVSGYGSITNSYWDIQTSGQTKSDGGIGLTTLQAKTQSSYTGLDFTNTWRIYDGYTYPLLKSFLTPITVTSNNVTATYNGQVQTSSAGVNYSTTLSNQLQGTAVVTGGRNVGTHTLTTSGLYSGQQGYDITFVNGTMTINPVQLTIAATNTTKSYDGTATALTPIITGLQTGDTVSNLAATYDDKNAGTGKTITITSYAIDDGNNGNNYNIIIQNSNQGVISKANLVVSAFADHKIYDGTDAATVILSDDRISGDDLILSKTFAGFIDKNAGTAKTVTVSGISLSGADAGNYSLQGTTTQTSANITARPLTITATGQNKVYDGTTATMVTFSDNRILSDSLMETYTTASFFDKNVGIAKTITVSGISLSGADAGNYSLQGTTTQTSANITARPLTITATGQNKIYDGTVAATMAFSDNRIAGDSLTENYTTASFFDKNVGTAKTVTVSGISLSGADAGNYSLQNTTAQTSATITARPLTVTAIGQNKVYDGTTATAAILSDNRILGDSLSENYTAANFSNKNAGTGKTITVSGISLSGADAGNYSLQNTSAQTSATITARPLTITATGQNKIYDGTAAATVSFSDNRIAGDSLTENYTTASFFDKNVGTAKAVTVNGISLSGADAGNYSLQSTTAQTGATITARSLTITATGQNKIYDGTAAAIVSFSDNRIAGDSLTENYTTASFFDKNVGTAKTVTVSGISLSGADAGNYSLQNTTAQTSATITARPLTVTAIGQNKVYDGTTATAAILSDNRIVGDSLFEHYTAANFSNKNAGTGKTITVSGISLSGADAGNYSLQNTSAQTSATITARPLTITATGQNKIYDGTAAATVSFSDNRIAGDSLTENYATASFFDKNVGTAKTVTVSGISLSGADAGNYSLQNTTAQTSATITARPLTVTAIGQNKVYDGTTAATMTLRDNRIAGDNLSENYTAANFSNKNAGIAKTVTVSGISLGGTDAGNYSLQNTTAQTSATITARPLTVTAIGQNKIYDGTTAATVSFSDNRIAGDSLTENYATASFFDKNVGTAKAVTVNGISLSGADAGNYSLQSTTAQTGATITARSLTVTAISQNKVYDGTAATTVALSDNRIVGDNLTENYTVASFDNKNAGTAKTVTVKGITLSGADAGNYSLQGSTVQTSADITAKALTVSGTIKASDKVYDGTTAAVVKISSAKLNGAIAGDSVSLSNSGTFSNKDVGKAKAVTVNLSGADAGNYNLIYTTNASITPRLLTVTATAENKVYDAATAATVTLGDDRIAGDSLTDNYSKAVFSDKNAGMSKKVTVSGISLSGADAGNYKIKSGTVTTKANITAKTINIGSIQANDKVYDGNTKAMINTNGASISGVIAGDKLSISGTGAFTDKNVGADKVVTISGLKLSGTDARNYSLQSTTVQTNADITPRPLTITVKGQSKVYDGTTEASVATKDNRIKGDSLGINGTWAFADKNVGKAKNVTVSGLVLSGADAGNYSLQTNTFKTNASITARPLTIIANAWDKVYDGTAIATVTLSDNRITDDNLTENYTKSVFFDKNVGTDKKVTVSGISLSGTDAGNYKLTKTTATTTADITVKALNIGTIKANNKVYDGTATATINTSGASFGGIIAGDKLSISGTGAFSDKNVGTDKLVTISGLNLSGKDARNYSLQGTTVLTTADITARPLIITVTGQSKVYDGTTAATVTIKDNRIAGDNLSINGTWDFADKNVGKAKNVIVSALGLSGTDAGNYSLQTNTFKTNASITARPLTVIANAQDKIYDGTAVATVTLSDNRITGDSLFENYKTAVFSDKNLGTDKKVTVSGISLSGTDASNYKLTSTTATTTADIIAKEF